MSQIFFLSFSTNFSDTKGCIWEIFYWQILKVKKHVEFHNMSRYEVMQTLHPILDVIMELIYDLKNWCIEHNKCNGYLLIKLHFRAKFFYVWLILKDNNVPL